MDNIKVSVVIPVCNVENYVRHTIESALAQTLEEIEIIIIDDGSTDHSPDIIDYYAAQDDRIVAIHKPNEGYGKACNIGIDRAQGEFVAILESDDFIDPEMYEELYGYATALEADVVKGPFKDCFAKDVTKPYPHNDFLTRNMPRNRLYSLAECPCQLAVHQSIWAGIYKRSYLNEHSIRFEEFPGAGHVDIKFCVESLVYSEKLAWLDKPFYNYRVEREGSSTASYNLDENVTRHGQMHAFFKPFEREFRAAASQLATREIIGSYRYFKKSPFTDEEFAKLSALFNDFTEEEILRAPIVSKADKEAAILCRNNPEESAARLRKGQKPPAKPKKRQQKPARPRVSTGELAVDWLYKAAVLCILAAMFFALPGSPIAMPSIAVLFLVLAFIAGILSLMLLARRILRQMKRRRK